MLKNFFSIIWVILFIQIFSSDLLAQNEDLFSEHLENVEILPSEIVRHLPMDVNTQIAYYVRYFSNEKREVLQRWFKRCEPFLPYFTVIFKEEGLPEDLIYLALVESGCNPFAVSPAGAVGIWQFIESTAKHYGLNINFWIDERRDFIKSTYAAAKYLKKLYEIFNDWRLAVASYNAGEGRILRALKAKNFVDYWKLMMSGLIPYETFAYLPQWLAVSAIAKNPQKYGFDLLKEDPCDYVELEVPGGLDLRLFSIAGDIDYELLRKLNAELRREFTPPNTSYFLKIPYSSKNKLLSNLYNLDLVEIQINTPEGEIKLYTLSDNKVFEFVKKTEEKNDSKIRVVKVKELDQRNNSKVYGTEKKKNKVKSVKKTKK